jgi:hypothetical protein
MESDHFIYTASQPLLAVAGVSRAHYLCPILHQLSDGFPVRNFLEA